MRRSFARRLSSLKAISAFVREFLAREGLDDDAASNLNLVLEELFTNLVKYGRGVRGDVTIALERGPDGVTAEVVETGAERFDPTAEPEVDVRQPLAERSPGGLGVHLVRRLAKTFRYEYEDGVGVTRVAVRIPRLELRLGADGHGSLSGRLDAAECLRVRPAFRDMRGPVTLDCSELDYISSAGLALFIETQQRLLAAGHALRLVNIPARLRVIFKYAGLDRLLDIG